ncbi:unannotated protein [freshwater metagenome]|uniref:Unannotated protein n=1 Tax=freshwater metagenome TaxID=449393 RepID=A0A6J7GSK6_9ZZZZ
MKMSDLTSVRRVATKSRRSRRIATGAVILIAVSLATTDATLGTPIARSALIRGERLCVTNNTGMTVQLTWSYTDTVDALPSGLLTAGATNCATGSNAGAYGLTVRVKWNDKLSQLFTVYNQTISSPQVVVDSDMQSAMDVTRCAQVFGWYGVNYCTETYDVNTSKTYTAYSWHESVLTRIADSADNKEFTLSLLK